MKALILAAGEGTRLRPLTLDKPKPMLSIAGVPLMEHTIVWLRTQGIQRVAINLHYKPQAITGYFGDGRSYDVELTYSYENRILGTAGAAKNIQDYLDETFVVVYGDVLTDLDLNAIIDFHRLKRSIATVGLYRVQDPSSCGIVEMDGSQRITRFVEKPTPEEVFTDLANAGVLVLEPEVLESIPSGRFYDFGHDLFPNLLDAGAKMYGYPIEETYYLIDIGSLDNYERAQLEWPRRVRC